MSFAKDPDFSTLCLIAFALRRRRAFRAIVAGGLKADAAVEELTGAIIAHVKLCGWDIYGVNSEEAVIAAFSAAILSADPIDVADMTRSHHQREGCDLRIAKRALEALRASGGNLTRLKPLPVAPTTHGNIHWSADKGL